MTLEEWEQQKARELDERLTALFQSVEPPEPSRGFVSRTMKAIRREPLPAGRHALRFPWTEPIGWAALVGAAAAITYGLVANQPIVAEALASFVALGICAGMWLVQSVHIGSAIFDVLATTGGAVARALSTREATGGLALMALIAALSLSVLNKLLFSEKESSSW